MVFQLHIGVLAFPFGTHAAPILTLVHRLAAAAPGTVFSFFNTADSNASIHLARVSDTFDNIQTYDIWDGTHENFSGTHFEAIALFLKASPANFEKAMEEAESQSSLQISCLITDAFLWFASDLAEKRGVPWIPFYTAASCSLAVHIYTDQIQNSVESAGLEKETNDQTVSFIPGLSAVPYNDLPPEIFINKNPTPMALTIYNMVQKLPKSTAIVLNSFEEIDPIITETLKSKFTNFLNIGPSILTSPTPTNPNSDPHNCLNWLQKHNKNPKSLIYISFGSVIVPPPSEIAALAETLESVKFPFLWSIRDKNLPLGFEDRTKEYGKIVPWAPQAEILRQNCIGVFVTHGGWNSVVESISGGVPMICRPFFGDQMINGRMVEDVWKIGVRVGGGYFSKSDMIKLLDYVMVSEGGEVIRENVCKLREKAVNAVGLKGSSSKNFEKLLEVISKPKGD